MEKIQIKYRTWYKGQQPRPIKMSIPGWAGDSNGHSNGDKAQPWHCPPFVEGSTYGAELIYPFDSECRVNFDGVNITFDGDFKKESIWDSEGAPPMMSFAPGHYGMTSCLDIMPPEGMVTRIEPHPRYFVDQKGDVPLAVPGHIQRFWPKIFFVAFKAPWPGHTHIFRKGEPYAKVLFVPSKIAYNFTPMTPEEMQYREVTDKKIVAARNEISKNSWKSDAGHPFDDKYKQLMGVFSKHGLQAVNDFLNNMTAKVSKRSAGRVIGMKKRK